MKLVQILLFIAGGFVGWFGHWVSGYQGIQWRFSEAASRGQVSEMEVLFANGASINGIPVEALNDSISGFAALPLAAAGGHADAVKWLLQHGADPNLPVSDTSTLSIAEHLLEETKETISALKAHAAKP